MLKIGVCISGGGTNLQAIIDSIENGSIHGASLKVVISNNAGAYGLERAAKHGIATEVVSPGSYGNREQFYKALMDTIDRYELDLIVLAGYLVILPPSFFEKYENRVINVHPSLIPAFSGTGFYGLKVHEAALKRGVKLTGATVHFVNADTDGGPIILQKAVAVKEGDTPESLQRRVMEEAEWILLPQAIDLIAAGRVSVTEGQVHIAPEGGEIR